jgi:methylmalonyl-CoA mutase N-terminal domain/subunit
MNEEKEFTTPSGISIKRVYTPSDIKDFDYEKDLNEPAKFPFTRGIYETMYRGRLWTMRQFAGMGTPKETNKRFKYLLASGGTGLSVAFHMPTIMGRDSDHPLSRGEIGKCGVAVDSLRDMEIIFDGINLEKITTSMTINAPACILWAMYLVVGEKQKADWKKLDGTIQNDILKEYIAQKSYIFPPGPSMRLILDTFEFCIKEVPKWHPISISGYHIREAGANAVQELAFTLADGLCYLYAAKERGINIEELLPKLSFFFNSHNYFFEEIAKFRAARRLWAREVKKRFNIQNDDLLKMKFHVQNAGCSLTAQQPYNNVIRTTLQALAAVVGGAQSIHTNSFDEALALPSEEAVKIALRTQQIIAYESGVADTIDPFAGSYYLEWLTNQIEEKAKEYITRIDEIGGMIKAIEMGFPQREIANASYKYQKEIEEEKRIIVGVNKFVEKPKPIKILKITQKAQNEQIKSLQKLKKERNNKKVKDALENLKEVAKSNKNIMPAVLDAVRVYATVGEICDVFREVFGEYKEPKII